MMDRDAATEALSVFLERSGQRKTSERFAVLDAICQMEASFSVEELENYMIQQAKFPVCRASIFNILRLLMKARLVIRHRYSNSPRYEGCMPTESGICRKVCSVCGNVSDFESEEVEKVIASLSFKRFKKGTFHLIVYGTCNSCIAKMSRRKNQLQSNKKKKP